jgi:hypothetical protein
MPHSERIKSAYLSRTALCVAVACAVSGARVLDGVLARKPKYAKISRMESVCQGAAIRRRGGGVGAGVCVCVGASVAGLSFMRSPQRRYTKIWVDTQTRAEKLQGSFCSALRLGRVRRHPEERSDEGSVFVHGIAKHATSKRDPPLRMTAKTFFCERWRELAVQREALHVPIEAVQRVVGGDHGAAARQQG